MDKNVESPDIETASLAYAKRFAGNWGTYLLAQQKALVAECIPSGTELKLLEVGGGHAQLANIYAERGIRATVFGSAGATVQQLDAFDVEYLAGNVTSLPFENASFDVVIAIRLLTHLKDWEVLLAEMCRVSKNIVIVEYPCKKSLNAVAPLLFKFKKKYEGDTRTFRPFNDTELTSVLEKYDFKQSSRKGQFFLPLVLHRMLKSNGFIRALEWVFRKIKLSDVYGSPVILSARKNNPLTLNENN